MSFDYGGRAISFRDGDSVLVALLRAGLHPTGGGCLCLAGDCPHCLAIVDGVAYVRTCQRKARPGLTVVPHPAGLDPPLPAAAAPGAIRATHLTADVVVIGQGPAGRAAAEASRAAGQQVTTVDSGAGQEAVGVYPGPLVVVRTPSGVLRIKCREVVVATGAAEVQPVCPGSGLKGIVTSRAAATLTAAGVDLGETVVIRAPERPLRFEGDDRVVAVVAGGPGGEWRRECATVVLDLGLNPRDALARMWAGPEVSLTGGAAISGALPPSPEEGVVCPCAGVSVSDLASVWERGFREIELLKRATLAGTGPCQGAACLPHLRAFVTSRGGEAPAPFTARPPVRPITLAEAAAGYHLPPVRRTALHAEHLRLGAQMDRFGGWWRPWRYGPVETEYRAVREAVSVGDVGTLGKLVVSGPDADELLERLYPCRVSDLRPGRARYTLLLDERGYVMEDGMICRDSATRFYLTFTSAGASLAEMWVRDWAETFGHDVRILDRTISLGAINVTGPRARELLARAGVEHSPSYLGHMHCDVAGVPCRVLRLGFTGELSFELHHPGDRSVELWRALLDLGADLGVAPHGLDALFALRLEKGHVIIGMDTEYDSTPRRLAMEWAVKLDKGDFIGRQALLRTNELPLDKRLVGLAHDGPAPAEGEVIWRQGRPVGQVTSARFSPVLGRSVMLGWVRLENGELPGEVEIAGHTALRTTLPFYDPEGRRARG